MKKRTRQFFYNGTTGIWVQGNVTIDIERVENNVTRLVVYRHDPGQGKSVIDIVDYDDSKNADNHMDDTFGVLCTIDITKDWPTVDELRDMFLRINATNPKEFVPLGNRNYYATQISNLYEHLSDERVEALAIGLNRRALFQRRS